MRNLILVFVLVFSFATMSENDKVKSKKAESEIKCEVCGMLGDVNRDGFVNSTDALIVLSCDAGMDVSQFCPMNCGDVNFDGYVNSTDALIILTYDAGVPVNYPLGVYGVCSKFVKPCPGCK